MKIRGSDGGISKTLIYNFIRPVAVGIGFLVGTLPTFQAAFGPKEYLMISFALVVIDSALGAWLRSKTTGPLK